MLLALITYKLIHFFNILYGLVVEDAIVVNGIFNLSTRIRFSRFFRFIFFF